MAEWVPLADQITWFQSLGNECAMGYNDSGNFWRFQWGPRGCGSMLEGFGSSYSALDAGEYLSDALAELREHLEEAL